MVEVKVRNVGQGNCNEIYHDGKLKIVYDLGTFIFATKVEVNNYINQVYNLYNNDKPILILSHWDLDHYHILKGMIRQNKCPFSAFFCIDLSPNKNQRQRTCDYVYNMMQATLGNAVHNISLSQTNQCPNLYQSTSLNQLINLSYVDLYSPNSMHTKNDSELVCIVKGQNTFCVLPGDSHYEQIESIFNMLLKKGKRFHPQIKMVVPHHGGDAGKTNNFSFKVIDHAVLSYGANNIYHHPQGAIINLFNQYNIRLENTTNGNKTITL